MRLYCVINIAAVLILEVSVGIIQAANKLTRTVINKLKKKKRKALLAMEKKTKATIVIIIK